VIEARGIMLDKGALVMLVDRRQEYLIYLNPKVIVPETAGLLLLAEESREQEVKRDILESDQPTECIVRYLMHWSPNVISTAIVSKIVYRKGIKVKA
jgi:hypothetical protein